MLWPWRCLGVCLPCVSVFLCPSLHLEEDSSGFFVSRAKLTNLWRHQDLLALVPVGTFALLQQTHVWSFACPGVSLARGRFKALSRLQRSLYLFHAPSALVFFRKNIQRNFKISSKKIMRVDLWQV